MSPLIPLARDLWAVDGHLPLGAGARFPVRATIVRLPDGGLWVHSPVRFAPAVADALDGLGPVRHLVAPSLLHHLWLGQAARRWPDAVVWGPPDLPVKRPDLPPLTSLDAPALPWDPVITTVALAGAPRVDERVFLHRPSRTLLVTDLVFHLLRPEGWVVHALTCLFGTRGRLASSRMWDLVFVRDRRAFGDACREVVALAPDRLVPCHGEVLEAGATEALAAALARWTRVKG